ncbi:TraR/DksA family transcriptional regulator [Devosia nitrariae]|uniref:Molecular chaperone DnaK n=1 Tax=Devosia nitrariae TaxID=2071872 RepID=A0ABQ5W8K3_9HYPH|nr:TraR/DksA C4-type zinc finger protein [Devosia nitrariae]GLQ56417.1 molecular chaperone DnaK [Devosia nitrariae]
MSDEMSKDQMESFARVIAAELEELDRLSRDTVSDRAPVALDWQSVGRLSRMDAMRGQALAQASDQRRGARCVALQMALRRIEEGEFGYCQDCGDPIALRRLEIDPAATLCIGCAQRSGR